MRRTTSLGFLALLLAGGTIPACGGDAWLDESNPSGNHFFDPRLAREIHSFWYVTALQVDAAAELLATRAVVSISPERATHLIGRVPDIPAGESLFLISALDVSHPTPVRNYK